MADPRLTDPDLPALSPDHQTPEQLRRWAGLIAAGEEKFPPQLQDPHRQRLAEEVRALWRERLLNLVASGIARDIVRQDRKDTEVLR